MRKEKYAKFRTKKAAKVNGAKLCCKENKKLSFIKKFAPLGMGKTIVKVYDDLTKSVILIILNDV